MAGSVEQKAGNAGERPRDERAALPAYLSCVNCDCRFPDGHPADYIGPRYGALLLRLECPCCGLYTQVRVKVI
jgi:hypothetical protein